MKPLGPGDPQHIGDYRVVGRLGEGGMGQVYLARSGRGRTVALKLVQPDLARQPEFRQRFRQEVEAARRIGGEWTAPVLDADMEAETPWVATGYVAGPSLHEVVAQQHGPLPEHSVSALANGLSHALADIHRTGLVHRDLKPSNVLVTIDGPRIIDFGIARAAEVNGTALTRTGMVVGSPGFMSPEQCRGETITAASDIFCLGSVLAFAATGQSPFGAAESAMHVLMLRIIQDEKDLSGVPESLRELIGDCLAADPAARPSVADLLARTAEADTWAQAKAGTPAGGSALEPWLPAALIAGLGRNAVGLLDSEDPEQAAADPATAALGTAPPTPPPGTPPPGSSPYGPQGTTVSPAGTPPPFGPPGTPPPGAAPYGAPGTPPPMTAPMTQAAGFGAPYGTPPGGATGYGQTPPPKNNRKTMWIIAAAVAGVLLVGGITAVALSGDDDNGGGGGSSVADSPGDRDTDRDGEDTEDTETPDDTEVPDDGGIDDIDIDDDAGGEEEVGGDGEDALSDASDGRGGSTGTFAPGETAVYNSGLEVTISDIEPFEPGRYASGHTEGNDAYKVTVSVLNNGEESLDTHVSLDGRAGESGRSAEQISDFEADLEYSLRGNLLPGRQLEGDFAFSVPEGTEFLDLEYSPFSYDSDTAIWTIEID